MARMSAKRTRAGELPEELRAFFWDCEFAGLRWRRHRDFIIGRVLGSGTWAAVKWLRSRADDAALRAWILRRRGRGLSPPQLRFWELILNLPHRQVTAWLRAPERQIWDHRVRR